MNGFKFIQYHYFLHLAVDRIMMIILTLMEVYSNEYQPPRIQLTVYIIGPNLYWIRVNAFTNDRNSCYSKMVISSRLQSNHHKMTWMILIISQRTWNIDVSRNICTFFIILNFVANNLPIGYLRRQPRNINWLVINSKSTKISWWTAWH